MWWQTLELADINPVASWRRKGACSHILDVCWANISRRVRQPLESIYGVDHACPEYQEHQQT